MSGTGPVGSGAPIGGGEPIGGGGAVGRGGAVCEACAVAIEGTWRICPLCGGPVTRRGRAEAGPLPDVPLRFSRRRLLRALMLTSVGMVLASFAVQLLITPGVPGLGMLRSIWLAVGSLWLVALAAVRKRRNLAKTTLYLVVLVGLVSVYWDYLLGWSGWSLDYVVPIVCGSSLLALIILVRVMRIEVGEHIVHSSLIVLLGLAPLVLLALGWIAVPLPSVLCGALSLVALTTQQLSTRGAVRHELARRLHL